MHGAYQSFLTLTQLSDLTSFFRREYYAGNYPYVRYFEHERWHQRLYRDPRVDVWLISWLPEQGTQLHDHGGSSGAFTVVSGELVEQTVRGGELADTVYREGEGHRFGAHFVHRIVNAGRRPAVTVHAYGPALTAMTRYRLHDGRLSVESITKAGADW